MPSGRGCNYEGDAVVISVGSNKREYLPLRETQGRVSLKGSTREYHSVFRCQALLAS